MPPTPTHAQEAGRAGRDGKPADCIVLYRPSDVIRLRYCVCTLFPTEIASTCTDEPLSSSLTCAARWFARSRPGLTSSTPSPPFAVCRVCRVSYALAAQNVDGRRMLMTASVCTAVIVWAHTASGSESMSASASWRGAWRRVCCSRLQGDFGRRSCLAESDVRRLPPFNLSAPARAIYSAQ